MAAQDTVTSAARSPVKVGRQATTTPIVAPAAPGRPYRGQSHADRQKERYNALMQSGLDVFGTQGLRHATIGEICCKARLANRFFNQHFSSLEALFDVVYLKERDRLIYTTQTALIESKATEQSATETVLRHVIRFFHDDPRRVRILLIDGPWRQDTLKAEGVVGHPMSQSLSDLGLRWMSYLHAGPKPDPGTLKLWHGLLDMTAQSIKTWALNNYNGTIAELVEHHLRVWTEVLPPKLEPFVEPAQSSVTP